MLNKKIVKTGTRFSYSPISIFSYIFFGVLIVAVFTFTIRTISTSSSISDQYDAIAVWQNNSEGNWDIAYSIYKQNSNSWIHQIDSDIYYEGDANLIAKLPGDDNDPDIASTKSSAMAVWSNTGMAGNQGADIFLAKWSSVGWNEPTRLFAMSGDDTDPTIYMQDLNNALSVWVNRNGGQVQLYYSEFTNGNWSNPQPVAFEAESITVPELGYLTVRGSRYLLTFTALVDGVGGAYMATYDKVNNWEVTKIDGQTVEAIVDSNIPAKYRTTSSMHVESRNAVAGWSGVDGNVWTMSANISEFVLGASKSARGANPVILQNAQDTFGGNTMLYGDGSSLFNVTPIGGSNVQTIANGESAPIRSDATYLLESGTKTGVAVWSSDTESPSEIYFSAIDAKTQTWIFPDRIDSKVFSGEDKNPAIAPILIRFTEEQILIDDKDYIIENEFCGNSVVEFLEACEIGVACKNKAQVCDWEYYTKKAGPFWAATFSDCECLSQDGDLVPPVVTPKGDKNKQKDKSLKEKSEILYGGFSCGFDSVVLKSAVGTGEVSLQFLPDTTPIGNGIVVFGGGYPNYQVDKFVLFPESDLTEDARLVLVDFSNNDEVITMTGIDTASGYQLCTGIFTKGSTPDVGGFVPASAPSGNDVIPDLPPETF